MMPTPKLWSIAVSFLYTPCFHRPLNKFMPSLVDFSCSVEEHKNMKSTSIRHNKDRLTKSNHLGTLIIYIAKQMSAHKSRDWSKLLPVHEFADILYVHILSILSMWFPLSKHTDIIAIKYKGILFLSVTIILLHHYTFV